MTLAEILLLHDLHVFKSENQVLYPRMIPMYIVMILNCLAAPLLLSLMFSKFCCDLMHW